MDDLVRRDPASRDLETRWLMYRTTHADLLTMAGQAEDALDEYADLAAELEKRLAPDRKRADLRPVALRVAANQGHLLAHDLDRAADAEPPLRASVELARGLVADFPQQADLRFALAYGLDELAAALPVERRDEADLLLAGRALLSPQAATQMGSPASAPTGAGVRSQLGAARARHGTRTLPLGDGAPAVEEPLHPLVEERGNALGRARVAGELRRGAREVGARQRDVGGEHALHRDRALLDRDVRRMADAAVGRGPAQRRVLRVDADRPEELAAPHERAARRGRLRDLRAVGGDGRRQARHPVQRRERAVRRLLVHRPLFPHDVRQQRRGRRRIAEVGGRSRRLDRRDVGSPRRRSAGSVDDRRARGLLSRRPLLARRRLRGGRFGELRVRARARRDRRRRAQRLGPARGASSRSRIDDPFVDQTRDPPAGPSGTRRRAAGRGRAVAGTIGPSVRKPAT
jgi:hypothetical protein